MGGAYFLQFLDKFILGQAALFNLREDLVRVSLRLRNEALADRTKIEPAWIGVRLDLVHFLFWVSHLALAEFIRDRAPPYCEISICYRLPLGRRRDVPCRVQRLLRPDGGSLFPGRRRSGRCARVQLDHWHVL